jgi:hypothetical protein
MTRHPASALLVLAALSLSGCAGIAEHNFITNNPWSHHPDPFTIRTVSINPVIAAAKFQYRAPDPRIDSEGAVPTEVVLDLMNKNGIRIEDIVRQEFISQLQRRGPFTLVDANADGEIKLTVSRYALVVRNEYHAALRPALSVSATLSDSKSKAVLETGIGAQDPNALISNVRGHTWKEYEANPELLRQGFQAAAATAVQELLTQLKQSQ